MKQWIVYKHTSIKSGKSYIGMTSKDIMCRWDEHVSEAMRNSTRHFHRAIRLYGADNWSHEILADCIDTIDEAYQLEKYYIKKHDTFENGYNLNEGGEGNPGLRIPAYFEKHTWVHAEHGEEECTGEELMVKFNLPRQTVGNYLRSSDSSKYIKQICGWVIKGRHPLPKVKITKDTSIVVYHDEFGRFEGTVGELSEITGKEIKHLSKLVKGKYNSIAGWRLTPKAAPKATNSKKVYVIDQGKVIKEYESSFAASEALGLRKAQMSEWLCKQPFKIINGKIYCYSTNFDGDSQIGVMR